MGRFYAEKKAGASKIEALQKAQLSLLRDDLSHSPDQNKNVRRIKLGPQDGSKQRSVGVQQKTKFGHPYYWGPFVLIGNWK